MGESPKLQIQCFGGFHVQLGEEPIIAFNTDKVRALCIYLATEAGQTFQRSHLAGLLWSDIPEEQALHNLRQAISLLRKALHDQEQKIVYVDREQVGIQPGANLQVDVLEFNQWMQAAYRYYKNQQGVGTLNIYALKHAMDLYKNPFLDRFHLNVSPLFDEWLVLTREQYDNRAVEGLSYLVRYYEHRHENANVLQMLRKIIKITPWDEQAHYQLMRFLALDEQWSAAQSQYASLVRYLKHDLNVEPDSRTLELFQQIRQRCLPEKLQQKPDRNNLSNLSILTNTFVGRKNELSELSEMIANPTCRLVTLLGLGGIGKTRLALELACMQVGAFSQGVFLVQLKGATTFDEVLNRIGQSLNLRFSDQILKAQQIIDFYRGKELFFVLDNLDYLSTDVEIQSFLAEMINNCLKVMLLITSREKLNIHEEQVYQLEGLNFRTPALVDGKKKLLSEALQLFEKRLQAIHRKFEIGEQDQVSISRLCHLVEGHPLAIELVAGSITGDVETRIEETIEQGIGAFISVLANSQKYQQTLTAVFEVSWQRLNANEKDLLSNLSVFKGGFDGEVLTKLFKTNAHSVKSLLDKSLLRCNFEGRYDMHEMVRQFAKNKLKESGKTEVICEIHAGYYFDLLRKWGGRFSRGEQSLSLDQIDQELINIKAAWDWMLATGRFVEMIDYLEILYQFFNIRSRFMEGAGWFQHIIDRLPDPKQHPFLSIMALNRMGSLAYRARQNELAMNSLTSCQMLLDELTNPQEMAFCLVGLGGVALRRKNYQQAFQHASDSERLYQSVADSSGVAYATYLQGLVLNRMGDYDHAAFTLERSLALSREVDYERQIIGPLNLLGDIACIKGNFDQAESFFTEALQISRKLGDRFNQAILLNNLSSVFHARDDSQAERKCLLESLSICDEIGDQDGVALAYNNLAEMCIRQGDYQLAIEYVEKGLLIANCISEEWTVIVSLNNLGEVYLKLQDSIRANDYLSKAIRLAWQIESLDMVSRIAVNLGELTFLQGDPEAGIKWLQASLAHSALEFDHQQKAIRILDLHQVEPIRNQNDELLERLMTEFCGGCI